MTSCDICVIGAGSGGLTVAAAAAQFGQKVVLIEKGEKREIEVTGTEKYFNNYVKNLEKNQFKVTRLPK